MTIQLLSKKTKTWDRKNIEGINEDWEFMYMEDPNDNPYIDKLKELRWNKFIRKEKYLCKLREKIDISFLNKKCNECVHFNYEYPQYNLGYCIFISKSQFRLIYKHERCHKLKLTSKAKECFESQIPK